MNITNLLDDLNINPVDGAVKAVHTVGVVVNNSSNRLSAANRIITALGAPKIHKEREAVIMSQALIELAIKSPTNFIFKEAKPLIDQRMEKLKISIPWAFVESANASKVESDPDKPVVADKKEKALAICKKNKDSTNAQLAIIISKEIGITYANAYYYASRVFKR